MIELENPGWTAVEVEAYYTNKLAAISDKNGCILEGQYIRGIQLVRGWTGCMLREALEALESNGRNYQKAVDYIQNKGNA